MKSKNIKPFRSFCLSVFNFCSILIVWHLKSLVVQHCIKLKLCSKSYHVELQNVLIYVFIHLYFSVFLKKCSAIEFSWRSILALNSWILISELGRFLQSGTAWFFLMVVFMVPWCCRSKSALTSRGEGNPFSSENLRKSSYKYKYPWQEWLTMTTATKMFWFPLFFPS